MSKREIEAKYLVHGEAWRGLGSGRRIVQGFLSRDPERIVRVRIDDDRGWLTVKGLAHGLERAEYSYEIPPEDARALLSLCLPHPVEKRRYEIAHAGALWEVDEFDGANRGLVLAEVELPHQAVVSEQEIAAWKTQLERNLPEWVGPEVSNEPRYYNSELSRRPFSEWSDRERTPGSDR